jgi:hypothetical protein
MTEHQAVTAAIAEAERFLAAAKAFCKSQDAKAFAKTGGWPSPYRAAAKRASLDLTRALARFRAVGADTLWPAKP